MKKINLSITNDAQNVLVLTPTETQTDFEKMLPL